MTSSQGKLVELDVRPQLRKKLEPFQLIMDAVKALDKSDTFVLHATFKPTPLLMLMKGKGFRSSVHQAGPDHWIVTFVHKSRKDEPSSPAEDEVSEAALSGSGTGEGPRTHELDNRGMQPPAPMIRTLKKLETIPPGDRVAIHNDRVPMFLIEELKELGYSYEIDEQSDGSAKVLIRKP